MMPREQGVTMDSAGGSDQDSRPHATSVTALSLGLLAAVTIGPLVLPGLRGGMLEPYTNPAGTWLGCLGVFAALGLVLPVRAILDRPHEHHPFALAGLLSILAAGMAAVHWYIVDSDPVRQQWQRRIYVEAVNLHGDDVPHVYRPLPYGFARLLECVTHDWLFACVAYRWFFYWWFLWASYRLARLYHATPTALGVVAAVALLYPASVWYYWGQLTDPLSHFLFVLGLIYLLQDRPLALAAALALGVAAKETAVLLAPVYLACWWRKGARALVATALLGVAGVVAYLAVRIPAGWRGHAGEVNGLQGLMALTNLGVGPPLATTTVPLWVNYLQPTVFVGPFVAVLAWRWRRIDTQLRSACLALTPLLLASNLCFGWLYESRNYMPLVPLLATAALPTARISRRATSATAIAATPA
jgi:hypothetical protein